MAAWGILETAKVKLEPGSACVWAWQSASTVRSTEMEHKMGRNHKSCFVLKLLPSKIKQAPKRNPTAPQKRLYLWFRDDSLADTGSFLNRAVALEDEGWQRKRPNITRDTALHIGGALSAPVRTVTELKRMRCSPDTLRSYNENMLKVQISYTSCSSQTQEQQIHWVAPLPPDMMEIHFMNITH